MRSKKLIKTLLLLVSMIFCVSALASGNKDSRRIPITAEQIADSSANLPTSSPEHHTIISRAGSSNLEMIAYNHYLSTRNKYPNDFYANLNCGVASAIYLNHLTHPDSRNGRQLSPSDIRLILDIQNMARDCLKKAWSINPNSGIANTEYGFFLFTRDEVEEEGMRLLIKGASIEGDNPRTHRLLGVARLERGTKYYNIQQAEQDLRKALLLDPMYAAPYYCLADIYTELKQFDKANRELSTYISLLPESAINSQEITWLRNRIQKHLR